MHSVKGRETGLIIGSYNYLPVSPFINLYSYLLIMSVWFCSSISITFPRSFFLLMYLLIEGEICLFYLRTYIYFFLKINISSLVYLSKYLHSSVFVNVIKFTDLFHFLLLYGWALLYCKREKEKK